MLPRESCSLPPWHGRALHTRLVSSMPWPLQAAVAHHLELPENPQGNAPSFVPCSILASSYNKFKTCAVVGSLHCFAICHMPRPLQSPTLSPDHGARHDWLTCAVIGSQATHISLCARPQMINAFEVEDALPEHLWQERRSSRRSSLSASAGRESSAGGDSFATAGSDGTAAEAELAAVLASDTEDDEQQTQSEADSEDGGAVPPPKRARR